MKLWPALSCVAIAVLGGVGLVTLGTAKGLSYLSDDPAACANCHIMTAQYDSWQKASHHTIATCNDCHLPHDLVGKYLAKAENGWNHSRAFTLQDFHEPILINAKNTKILERNCLECHADYARLQVGHRAVESPSCVRCHSAVGHGEHVGLGGPLRELPTSGDAS